MCTKNNALCAMYPPKGFISRITMQTHLHIILFFTWSETGDGYFKYIDGYTGDEIIIPDKKGRNVLVILVHMMKNPKN